MGKGLAPSGNCPTIELHISAHIVINLSTSVVCGGGDGGGGGGGAVYSHFFLHHCKNLMRPGAIFSKLCLVTELAYHRAYHTCSVMVTAPTAPYFYIKVTHVTSVNRQWLFNRGFCVMQPTCLMQPLSLVPRVAASDKSHFNFWKCGVPSKILCRLQNCFLGP